MIGTIVYNIMEEQNYDSLILEIFPTGSQMFQYGEPSDLDYVVILDTFPLKHKRFKKEEDGKRYDVLFLDFNTAKDRMNFKFSNARERDYLRYNYFYAIRNPIFGEKSYDIDLMAHKDQYLFLLKHYYDKTLNRAVGKEKVGKSFVHYYIALSFLQSGNYNITDEMKEMINKLYQQDRAAVDVVVEMIKNIPQVDLVVEGE